MDWFLYDIALRHERLKKTFKNAKFYRMSKKTSEIKVTKSKAYVYAKNIQTFNVSIHNYPSICQCLLNHLQFDYVCLQHIIFLEQILKRRCTIKV